MCVGGGGATQTAKLSLFNVNSYNVVLHNFPLPWIYSYMQVNQPRELNCQTARPIFGTKDTSKTNSTKLFDHLKLFDSKYVCEHY